MKNTLDSLDSETLAGLCRADGEFQVAARFWTGGLRLDMGSKVVCIRLQDGVVVAGEAGAGEAGVLALSAPDEVWDRLTAAKPPRFYTDVATLMGDGRMILEGEPLLYAQYYPAVMRAVEVIRPAGWEVAAAPRAVTTGAYDAPVGRYIHIDLAGQDYRIYFEEAGAGIPILLQHTAGAHGSQWRHLFERPEITDHFRLIAYDLPFHGKSIPPTGPRWWAETYRLTAAMARALPVRLAAALGLERPVFMGCSVGGVLALDLARHHPEAFRAVISLEGALKIGGDLDGGDLDLGAGGMWHPQVSNAFKARLVNSLMSPTSPEAYRQETMQVYSAGWPPAFAGDVHYYLVDYDLRGEADKIDTSQVAVHILSGEYDTSGTMELGQAAHAAIPGSTWTGMQDVGHFPMSENPDAFMTYLTPVLDRIRRQT